MTTLLRGAALVLFLGSTGGLTPASGAGPAPADVVPSPHAAMPAMEAVPGMAELMERLGPGVACPRGGCGFGLDGIPEPRPGSGLQGIAARSSTGGAGGFSSSGARLSAWLTSSDLAGSPESVNDIWGHVSRSGREYAIVGLRTGTAFVEVTDPSFPRVVAVIPGPDSHWRDMAVFRGWAYSVNERGDGIQVIDLRRIDEGRVRLRRNVVDDGLRTAHNIFVNPDSGYAYLLGSNLSRGGLVAVDLKRPGRPRLEPVIWDSTYVHDVEVVTYRRGRYRGREIAFAFTGRQGLHIVDVTDKAAPLTIAHYRYPDATYGHSGALGPNRRFLYVNDELDERQNPRIDGMTTYVIRVANLAHPKLVKALRWQLPIIDHNSMIQGDRLYISAYQGGLRIVDLTRPKNPEMVGWFDTYPHGEGPLFTGAWGIFAGFPSGNVVVSDVENGLFVVQPER